MALACSQTAFFTNKPLPSNSNTVPTCIRRQQKNNEKNRKKQYLKVEAVQKIVKTSSSPGLLPDWNPGSWRSKKALQQPTYGNTEELQSVLRMLGAFPPLVFAGEARKLEEMLGEAALGNAFLLQGGDCAESFKEFNANNIRDTFRVILQMAVVLMFGSQMPVVKACEVYTISIFKT